MKAKTKALQLAKIEKEYIPFAGELMRRSKEIFNGAPQIEVKFLTPTAFKQDGRYVLYPTAQMMIGNLINKWNSLNTEMVIDDEYAVNEINNGLSIVGYRLQSANYYMKRPKVYQKGKSTADGGRISAQHCRA